MFKEVVDVERLQKVIANSGICSRRKAEELILAGKVEVNGKVVTELGTKVTEKDEVSVNGKIRNGKEEISQYSNTLTCANYR